MAAARKKIVVIGGGAAGFFGAIRCAELAPAAEVVLCEATARPLAKVRISGGGRCNVTHAGRDLRDFVSNYPRGARELLGPLHRFGPRETVAWFEDRGVALKTETDGRMFPVTDDSATIVACLQRAAAEGGVIVRTRCAVQDLRPDGSGRFVVTTASGETFAADRVLLATGGNPASAGLAVARALGHTIEPPVPSLFTFHCDDARLRGLAGVAVSAADVRVSGARLAATGPLLITHWGLSGPAILRVSAWGARTLQALDYRFPLVVSWISPASTAAALEALAAMRNDQPRRRVASANPFGLPARLWERLVDAAGIRDDAAWASLSKGAAHGLTTQVTTAEFVIAGRSPNKEEFVTCGGVRLSEVDFRTMESRVCPGLFLAGEVLDIDGLTGGFNFQSAWTTGWHAGSALAAARTSS